MPKEVLIVDDDRSLARGLERAVTAEGYDARLAHDGEAALAAIGQARPTMVLLDLLLPKKDGQSVLEQLRCDPSTQDLPVVVMTGVFKGRGHRKTLEESGAQGFIEKPFRKSDLMPLLRRYLGRPGPKRGQISPDSGEVFQLRDTPVAEVLWRAMRRKTTGGVVFESGKARKIVFLQEGVPTRVRSNLARECLGNRLLAAGRIDEPALRESVTRARAGEGRQGEILVQMGAVSEAEIEDAVRTQSEEKLLELFGWTEGAAQIQNGLGGDDELCSNAPRWSPQELILRGARLIDPERVRLRLDEFAREEVRPGPDELTQTEESVPGVAELLSRLGERATVSDLAARAPGLLYALRVVRAVVFGDEVPPEDDKPDAAGRLLGVGELEELLEEQQGQNHFEVLDLGEDASDEDVRGAYLKLAKRFHPDRYASERERELAAEVFARITEAHETLSGLGARNAYLRSLREGSDEEKSARVTKIMSAETQFHQGLAHFRKREYAQALEKLDWAIELNGQEGEFHALRGWTHFLAHQGDENAAAHAQEGLERALALAPKSAEGHYYFGMFRRACGDLEEAERMFRRAVELNPTHEEASRELRLINMRKERGGGKLFGRKKR